jgi:hypothetical protein
MNHLSIRIGYWSSIALLVTFVVWIISFAGIAATSPLFYWTGPADYMAHYQSTSHYFQHLAYFFMLLAGPIYLLIINSYYEFAPEPKKILARISLYFGLGYAVLSSLHYFVQLSAVRLNLLNANFDGMESFLQANPLSVMTSIDMLGWTMFLGLSSLFMYPVFSGDSRQRILRYAFLLNGVSCLMAGVGYVLKIDVLTFICINICTGGAMIVIAVASLKQFARQQN